MKKYFKIVIVICLSFLYNRVNCVKWESRPGRRGVVLHAQDWHMGGIYPESGKMHEQRDLVGTPAVGKGEKDWGHL